MFTGITSSIPKPVSFLWSATKRLTSSIETPFEETILGEMAKSIVALRQNPEDAKATENLTRQTASLMYLSQGFPRLAEPASWGLVSLGFIHGSKDQAQENTVRLAKEQFGDDWLIRPDYVGSFVSYKDHLLARYEHSIPNAPKVPSKKHTALFMNTLLELDS